MTLSIQIELTPDQIRAIAESVAAINLRPRTYAEAAKELRCSARTIRRKVEAKLIPSVPGNHLLIPAEFFQRTLNPESEK